MKKMTASLCLVLLVFSLVACKQVGKNNKAVVSIGKTNNVVASVGTTNNVVASIGKIDNAIVSIGKSDKFSEKEINNAIDCVKKKFVDFKGCRLTQLWYDEEKSDSFIKGYMSNGKGSVNGVKAENVIVLLSNYDVDSSGGDGSLNPNSTYSSWNWILIRDSKTGTWRADDWGY